MIFQNKIKEIMTSRGISAYKLAHEIGLSVVGIYGLLKREDLGNTPLKNIIKIAKILEVEPSELYCIKEE